MKSLRHLVFLLATIFTASVAHAQTQILPQQVGQNFYVDGFPGTCTIANVFYSAQADCAWATAYQWVVAANGQYGAQLIFGSNYYPKNVEWIEPTTTNGQGISLHGAGMHSTYLLQTTSTPTVPMLSSPEQYGNLMTFDLSDMTFVANNDANSCADIIDVISSNFSHLDCTEVIDGSDHMWQFGAEGRNAQELVWSHIFASGMSDAQTRAQVSATVSGGTLSFNVTNAGAGYPATQVAALLVGTGVGDKPCSTMGVTTATVAGGVVTGVTSTASGCVAPVYVSVYPLSSIGAGFRLFASDSTGYDMYPQGTLVGVDLEYGNTTLYHTHPTNLPIGIVVTQNDVLDGTECDTISQWCFDFENPNTPVTVTNTNAYTGLAASIPGYATFHFGATNGPAQIVGLTNLCEAGLPVGYNEIVTTGGAYPTGSLPNGTDIIGNDTACGSPLGDIITQPVNVTNQLTVGNITLSGADLTTLYGLNIHGGMVFDADGTVYNNGTFISGGANQRIFAGDGSILSLVGTGGAIAADSSINLTNPATVISGTGTIGTLGKPSGCATSNHYACEVTLFSQDGFSFATGGNIAAAKTYAAGVSVRVTWRQENSMWYPE